MNDLSTHRIILSRFSDLNDNVHAFNASGRSCRGSGLIQLREGLRLKSFARNVYLGQLNVEAVEKGGHEAKNLILIVKRLDITLQEAFALAVLWFFFY